MSNEQAQEKLYLRIELDLLLEEILGDRHYCCISERLAVGLIKLTNNHPDRGIYVLMKDELSPDLKYPILWRYSAWVNESARRKRTRERAQKEQDERWIRDANVSNLTRCILRKFPVTDSQASMIATKMWREQNMPLINVCGLTRIITDVKDI